MADTSALPRDSDTMGEPLRIFVYPPEHWSGAQLHHASIGMARGAGLVIESVQGSDVALAPLLRYKLSEEQWTTPRHGTLIFHPSMLPLNRGPDAVRWVVNNGERFTGATWFWCSGGMDAGDIWEQEMAAIPDACTAGRLYHHLLVPAALRCLSRGLTGLLSGYARRAPQDQAAATYFKRIPVP